MAKTELTVLFKKMQRDDKKEVLKFEVAGGDSENKTATLYEVAGGIVNFELLGKEIGPITAEFAKLNRDSKKTVLDFNLKGDSHEKALQLYQYAGETVDLSVEPSQMTLEEFHDDEDPLPFEDDPHAGIEYEVDITSGNATVKGPEEDEGDELED